MSLHKLEIEVCGVKCEAAFWYWPEEGDGWDSERIPEEYEIVECEPEMPDEDVIKALKEYKEETEWNL